MRIEDQEDRAIRLHSHAIAAAREPKPAAKLVRQPCTAVWAESFSKIMGEGVCGKAGQMKPDQKYLPLRTDFANSSRRASRWDVGCWTEADAILGGKCDVLTMDQRREQWPLGTEVRFMFTGCDVSGRARKPFMVTGKVAKHWRPEEYPYHCSVHFHIASRDDPLGQLVRHEVVPFHLLEKIGDAQAGSVARPRQPGEFFVGDRVYVDYPVWNGMRFTVVQIKNDGNLVAKPDRKYRQILGASECVLPSQSLRLLDEQPDVS
jgi:hypothetical protein